MKTMRRHLVIALVVLAVTAGPAAAQLPDLTPPVIVCGTADTSWHPSNVGISCTASDPESGVPNAADQAFDLFTTVAAGTETNNAATGTRLVCNGFLVPLCSTAGPVGGNMVDLKAPANPLTIQSTDHLVGIWTRDRTIAMAFGAGSDGGSGVDGFSWAFTRTPSSVPDAVKDGEETARDTTSALLGSGVWYFHLSTVDNVGTWSAPAHVGPFLVDVARPAVRPLSMFGRPGQVMRLRYRTADNSGRTRERLTLRRNGAVVRTWSRAMAGAPWGMVQRVSWRPRVAGTYSLCVSAWDPAANNQRGCRRFRVA
jgi:hypothetical protein